MKVVIITQARMTSTRLPGKVLKTIQGKSLLEHHLDRLNQVPSADTVVVATTKNEADNVIVDLCNHLSIAYYRGSEHDVLARYYETALLFKADIVVRVTSDCPVIDPEVIEMVIQKFFQEDGNVDYMSNTLERTFPIGTDVEVFTFKALEEANNEATSRPDREHVAPFIWRQPDRYRIANVSCHQNLGHHRWTVDTEEDFQLIKKIVNALYPSKKVFNISDILSLFDLHPDWLKINAHVQQKKYCD